MNYIFIIWFASAKNIKMLIYCYTGCPDKPVQRRVVYRRIFCYIQGTPFACFVNNQLMFRFLWGQLWSFKINKWIIKSLKFQLPRNRTLSVTRVSANRRPFKRQFCFMDTNSRNVICCWGIKIRRPLLTFNWIEDIAVLTITSSYKIFRHVWMIYCTESIIINLIVKCTNYTFIMTNTFMNFEIDIYSIAPPTNHVKESCVNLKLNLSVYGSEKSNSPLIFWIIK